MKKFYFNSDQESELRRNAGLSDGDDNGGYLCSGATCSDSEKIQRINALYDLADMIKDQRYDVFVTANNGGKSDAELTEQKRKNYRRSRIAELYQLLMEIRNYKKSIENSNIYISTNNTAGNIYLRLSQCYLDVFEYRKAKEFAQKGRERLWNALQEQEYSKTSNIINELLIHLNLAKYYREWSELTRRSNYEIAIKELDIVFENLLQINFENEENRRQIALICVDAMINKGRIFRLDYRLSAAKNYLKTVALHLLKFQNAENDKQKKALETIYRILNEMSDSQCKQNELINTKLEQLPEFLEAVDRKEYFLSSLIQISLVLIKQRQYVTAEELSKTILIFHDKNHDAKNNLGICYRKRKEVQNAIDKFLEVVNNDSKKTEVRVQGPKRLKDFLEKEINKINRKENGEWGSENESLENWKTIVNRFAYINLLKCILDLYETDSLDHSVFMDAKKIIDLHLKHNPNDYEVGLLNCRYLIEYNQPEEAIRSLELMITKPELSYVRRGTMGLKARYQLAKCYLKCSRLNEAEKLLILIRTEVHKDGTGNKENQFDPLVENDIGRCLLLQGRYEEALNCYKNLINNIYITKCAKLDHQQQEKEFEQDNAPEILDKIKDILGESLLVILDDHNASELTVTDMQTIKAWEHSTQLKIPYLNNMGVCYLKMNQKSLAEEIFELIIRIKKHHGISYLYAGYCKEDKNERENYFRKAFRYAPEEIEVRSGYLINMIDSYVSEKRNRTGNSFQNGDRILEKLSYEISNFIDYMPYNYSLNMCLALLHWMREKDSEFMDSKDLCRLDLKGQMDCGWKERKRFYISFSRIELYNELGARAFDKLKSEPGFHHLKAAERGLILAHLFYLYEPIIKIRKKCQFQYEHWKKLIQKQNSSDLQTDQKSSQVISHTSQLRQMGTGLVHYTKLDTLKALLDQSGTPHLRVSNCGYMNDLSEGEIFFDKIRSAAKRLEKQEAECDSLDNRSSQKNDKDIEALIQCYFHELQGNLNRVLPRGGNVYITSLSTNVDSFPMWDIYAGKEQGCNIEFEKGFFDLKGNSWGVCANTSENGIFDYGISAYTDDDYPLYAIQYVNHEDEMEQDGADATGREFFDQRLKEIVVRWNKLDELLDKLLEIYDGRNDGSNNSAVQEIVQKALEEIRAFVANRINEVRYLFKDEDYKFEGEVRLVCVVDANDNRAHTDSREIPRAFTEVDKEIKDIIVTLGSKLNDEQVNEITTWLKHTGRVKDVRIATRNRARKHIAGQS